MAATFRSLGWSIIGLLLILSGPTAALRAAHLTAKCKPKMIDTFKSDPTLFNLNQGVTLASAHPQAGSALALPGQKGTGNILTAQPSATPAGVFSFGRRFPIPENWSKDRALTFWYHGHNTGKSIAVTLYGQQAADPGPANWTLHWSDEFNGPAGTPPDPAVWNHEIGDGSANNNPGWGNQELESYTDSTQNAAMDGNGNLLITARKADPAQNLSCYYGPCQYTSARLTTQSKIEVAYGRIEARIRIPTGAGMWSAFWMLGTNINSVGWPQSGEVDVMENVGRQPNLLYGTIHGPGYEGVGIGGTYTAPGGLSDDFHTYAVQWQPGSISWTIDGKQYFAATKKDAAPNPWVFNHAFFILLNLAVGGAFGGSVASDTAFPQSMAVDYVRLSGPPDTAARFQSSFTDNVTGWKQITLPFSTFTRATSQPAGAPDGSLHAKTVLGYSFAAPAGLDDGMQLAKVGLIPRTSSCKGEK
jgi:beta-glucanase (GH16 family)